MTGTYRPRVSRDLNRDLTDWASRIAGKEMHSHRKSLELVLAYLDQIDGEKPDCPTCAGDLRPSTPDEIGDVWHCRECGRRLLWYETLPHVSEDHWPEVPVEPKPSEIADTNGTNAGWER